VKSKLSRKLYSSHYFVKYFGNDSNGAFRNRRILHSSISSFGARGVSILISLLCVPLTFNYLNPERFGVMMTIVSLITVINFVDFGIAFGLQNQWAELSLDKTGMKIKKAISSVFFYLLFVSLLLLSIGILLYQFVDLSSIFRVDSKNVSFIKEVNVSAFVFFIFTSISIPFSIVQRIQMGKQEGYLTNIWNIIANILTLLLLIIFIKLKLGIPYIIIALHGVNNIIIISNFIYEFCFKHKDLFPHLKLFDFKILKMLVGDGLVYLINQVGTMILTLTNNIFLANYYGAATVGLFNIGIKFLSLFQLPLEATAPYFLPAFNDAIAKKEMLWVKRTLKRYLQFISIYSLLIFLVIYFFGDTLLTLWLSKAHLLSQHLLLAFAFFGVCSLFVSFIMYTMLSSKFIFFLLKVYPISVLIVTLIKWKLVRNYSIEGILYTQAIVLVLLLVVPCLVKLKKSDLL